MTASDTHRTIDAVWRIESARLIAGLARIVRDVGLAEDLAHDALVAALEQWPESGVPDNPGAWLMAAAKHRAIDHFRRNKLLARVPLDLVEAHVADQARVLDREVARRLVGVEVEVLVPGPHRRREERSLLPVDALLLLALVVDDRVAAPLHD